MSGTVDAGVVAQLTRAVRERLSAETSARLTGGRDTLDAEAQRAFCLDAAMDGLRRIDETRLGSGVARLDEIAERAVVERVVANVVGLGPVEVVLADPTVEEIVATRWYIVFVYRSDGSVERLREPLFESAADVESWIAQLARTAGRTERQFNGQAPLLVLRIGEGLRLAATRDVSQHVSFDLRRNTLGKVTVGDLVGRGMLPPVLAELFSAGVRTNQMKFVLAGATGTGKTTLARAMLAELDPFVRLVVVEDTAELDLFDEVAHPNVEEWEERLANSEGEGAISCGRMVKHALRYRPDWLTLGECRDSDAVVPLVKAMTHGQASLTTVHADDAAGAINKLALYLATGEDRLPIDAAHYQLSQAVTMVVHIDRRDEGHRYVSEVMEVAGFDGSHVQLNTIASYDRTTDDWVTANRFGSVNARLLARAGFDVRRLAGTSR